MTNGVISPIRLPEIEDTVRLLLPLMLLLLRDSDSAERLDLEDTVDRDPEPDAVLDPEDPADERPHRAVRPDLEVRSVMEDTSGRSDLDDSSEMEDILVFEIVSDSSEGNSVGWFCSGSSCARTMTLMKINKFIFIEAFYNYFISPKISLCLDTTENGRYCRLNPKLCLKTVCFEAQLPQHHHDRGNTKILQL